MGSFLRGKHGVDYEQGFVQGAGRILIAPGDTAWPLGIEDILELTAGATLYDPVTPWDEVGFTKTGINIVRNNAEETFTVDQIRSAIKTRPSNWEMSVGTQLAEASLETFALAWELPDPVTVTKTAPALNESHTACQMTLLRWPPSSGRSSSRSPARSTSSNQMTKGHRQLREAKAIDMTIKNTYRGEGAQRGALASVCNGHCHG
jgi:hypothetical protein